MAHYPAKSSPRIFSENLPPQATPIRAYAPVDWKKKSSAACPLVWMPLFFLLAEWWSFPAVAGAAATPGPGTGPRVEQVQLKLPSGEVNIGTVFRLEVDVTADPAIQWHLPAPMTRQGDFTLRRAVAAPHPDGRVTITMELQAFQTGTLSIPSFPVEWSRPGEQLRLLSFEPGKVEVANLLKGDGPFLPRPPRVILENPAETPLPWAWLLAAAVVLAAGVVVMTMWARRRRPAAAMPVIKREPPSIERFLAEVDRLWDNRHSIPSQRVLAAAMMAVFRDFLSWRFNWDFRSMTADEIYFYVKGHTTLGDDQMAELERAVQTGEAVCFAPTEIGVHVLPYFLKSIIIALGPPPSHEVAHAVPEVS